MSRNSVCVLVATIALLASPGACASALLGTSVTGDLQLGGLAPNFFDPASGNVPATGFGNSPPGGTTVVIAEPLIEFGYTDPFNTITANFTDNTLTINDHVIGTNSGMNASQLFTFTDNGFLSDTVTKNTDTFFGTGADGAINGSSLTVSVAQGSIAVGQTYSASFTIAPAVSSVPLPPAAYTAILGGLTAFSMRRKLLRTA